MECFKYYLPISLPNGDEPLEITFTINDQVAGKIIGFNGRNIRNLRKKYDVDFKIDGSKFEKERKLTIKGNDKFKVFQQVQEYIYYNY